MENRSFLSIIIPTYNRANLLPLTLDSFLAQNYPRDRYEIIIADNNSTDTTREVSTKYVSNSDVPVKYIFEQRQGVHYARNSAAKIAKGEILYFTDDDMIADPSLLTQIVKVFELFPEVGCATGLILPLFQIEPPAWVNRYMWNGYLSLTEKNRDEDLIVSKNYYVYSCHQAIRKDLFFLAGGYNPENTAGTWVGDGETGLNIKLKSLGHRFAYTSKSIIYHVIPKTRTTLKYLVRRMSNQGYCNSYTDYRKHRDRSKIIPLMLKRNTTEFAINIFITIAKIAMGRLSWHFLPAKIIYFHKRNTYDLRLYKSKRFREIAEIDDWINTNISF